MVPGLHGKWSYAAGTSGTVTLPEGAVVCQISARSTAGGTITIFGGATITIPANGSFDRYPPDHALCIARGSATDDIVFTGTTAYYVEYIYP